MQLWSGRPKVNAWGENHLWSRYRKGCRLSGLAQTLNPHTNRREECQNGSILQVYTLADVQYAEVQTSPTFAPVSVKEIPWFIQEAKKNGEIATTRAFRAWVQEKISGKEQ